MKAGVKQGDEGSAGCCRGQGGGAGPLEGALDGLPPHPILRWFCPPRLQAGGLPYPPHPAPSPRPARSISCGPSIKTVTLDTSFAVSSHSCAGGRGGGGAPGGGAGTARPAVKMFYHHRCRGDAARGEWTAPHCRTAAYVRPRAAARTTENNDNDENDNHDNENNMAARRQRNGRFDTGS